jgi:Ca2+-binding RTX toxin-like protein
LNEDTVRIITAADLLQGASDAETETADLEVVDLVATSGTLVEDGEGRWIFTPDANDETEVTFNFKVSDGDDVTAATAKLDLLPVNIVLSDKGGGARYTGTDAAEDIYGGRGNDRIKAEGGDDQVWGGNGNDRLYGGEADDLVDGGKGNDRVYGDEGDDQVLGGTGNDRAYGGAGADIIGGDVGNDHLYGGEDDDEVDGGKGNDHLYGEAGNDVVWGDTGNDHINGGEGDDDLSGGDGHDRFVFKGVFGDDKITDFDVENDTLHINGTTYSKGNFDQLVVTLVDTTTVLFQDGENSITLENVDPNDFGLLLV